MDALRDHYLMIDLNPLVQERHPIKPPSNATAEEYNCQWYSITDRVQYLPGGLLSGKVTYSACLHDLPDGLQTHVYAPMGLDIKEKWSLGGTLPGEPAQPVELGINAPLHGLYLREDIDMRCNIVMSSFVKKTLKKAHARLVERMVAKSHLAEAVAHNERLSEQQLSPSMVSAAMPPGSPGYSDAMSIRSSNSAYDQGSRVSYQKLLRSSGSHNSRSPLASPAPLTSPAFGASDPGYREAFNANERDQGLDRVAELPSDISYKNTRSEVPEPLRISRPAQRPPPPAELE